MVQIFSKDLIIKIFENINLYNKGTSTIKKLDPCIICILHAVRCKHIDNSEIKKIIKLMLISKKFQNYLLLMFKNKKYI